MHVSRSRPVGRVHNRKLAALPSVMSVHTPLPGIDCIAGAHCCLLCAEEGELRLVGRVDVNGFSTGAVQVFHNGAFGAVCIEGFDAAAADVACRQLGFVGGTDIPLAIRGSVDSKQERSVIEVRACSIHEACTELASQAILRRRLLCSVGLVPRGTGHGVCLSVIDSAIGSATFIHSSVQFMYVCLRKCPASWLRSDGWVQMELLSCSCCFACYPEHLDHGAQLRLL